MERESVVFSGGGFVLEGYWWGVNKDIEIRRNNVGNDLRR